MTNHGLTSVELRERYANEIRNAETFRTHGVDEAAAQRYLDTPEGTRYWLKLRAADPNASMTEIDDRAIDHLRSGGNLPRMEVIDEPLVKIVPAGESVSAHSPFFAKRSELEDALVKAHNLADRFGLPIKSEATVYDVCEIHPKGPTEAFVSRVAATSELGGQVTKAGGAEQYLVPNRGLYTESHPRDQPWQRSCPA